jgi:hypothetical protein
MTLPLIPQDKANHFIYGCIIYFLVSTYLTPIQTMGVVTLTASIKELYDYKTKTGTPELMDVVWTLLGALTILITQITT